MNAVGFLSMEKMKSDAPLDYAVFQLSPKRSRCELIVSSDGKKEKLASGLLKPFIAHLKVAEEQFASAGQSVNLEVGRNEKAGAWFTKGTLERFVRFVSTPEILELVNTFEAEMSQLEAARRIYSQGAGGSGLTAADDATKKELLRAIDVRLTAVHQDLSAACARAVAAGFDIDAVSELQIFADRFGAHRLNDACAKFISLCQRRPNLTNSWKTRPEDRAMRLSYGSDMSIDEDPLSPPPARQEPAASQLSKPQFSVERDDRSKTSDTMSDKDSKDGNSTTPQSISSSQLGRRLSVQDRISMFENKQKETTGPKLEVKPGELRRMSSDVSAAEKAVLRRWSGASDMSMDLSADKEGDSPSSTTSLSVVFPEKTVSNFNDNKAKSSSAVKPEIKIIPSSKALDSFNKSDQYVDSSKAHENDGLKDCEGDKTQSKYSTDQNEKQDSLEEKFNTLLGGRNEGTSMTQTRLSQSRGVRKAEIPNQREDSVSTEPNIQARSRVTQKAVGESVSENVAGSRIREAFAARFKGIESNSMPAQQETRSIGKTEVVDKKELNSSEDIVNASEYSGPQKMKLSRQGSATELSKTVQVQRDESNFCGNNRPQISVKLKSEAQEGFDSFSTPPPEQAQKVRQSKGNQELNDELKSKANELEKLFAEHKLRLPNEQPNSGRKSKTGSTSQFSKPVVDASPKLFDYYQSEETSGSLKNKPKFSASSPAKTVESDFGPTLHKSFSDLSVSEGSRGKFYDTYMQKRDAKLRQEWSSNRAEKEARLKSMQDSLNRSRSEMKVKFSGSAARRAERLRSYSSMSITKNEQQSLEYGDSEDDEDAYKESYDISVGDGSLPKSAQGKKHLSNGKSQLSSASRTTVASVPRSATKTSTINSGKRRTQPENPLAQSVPNFSDLRKENTKPSTGGSKMSRLQVRNNPRSKSTNEEADTVKVTNGVVLTPIKFDEEIMRSSGSKPFLKKGSRLVFDARASIARQKAESSTLNNVEENEVLASQSDDFVSMEDVEIDEHIETLKTEDEKISDDEKLKVRLESDNFGESESENDDNTQFSRLDQALGSQLPNESAQDLPGESPISWNSRPFSYPHEMSDVENSVDSPVGSPASWSQMEIDAARMRKKWGTAQKPMVAAHSSNNNVMRKDRNKGFKRFLQFGRKNNGSESLLDWLSATTSEGDDDMEDGRDIANRYSEDLRKSRMAFPMAQPSDDGFNESEYFNESVQSSESSIAAVPNFKLREDHMSGSSNKAPRSFFSLSTFRSKGSDSKPR